MLLKYPYFYLKCTVHSLTCAKFSWVSRSRHFSQPELSGQWVWLTACSGPLRGWDTLYPSLCAGAKAGWKWHSGAVFSVSSSLVFTEAIACTPCHRWERRGQLCHLWPLTPHVPMLLYSDLHLFEWESAEDQHSFTNVQTARVLWTLLNKYKCTVGFQYSHAFPCPPCTLWSRKGIMTPLSTQSWVLLLVAGSQVLP